MKFTLWGITLEITDGRCHGKIKYGHWGTAVEASNKMNVKDTTRRKLQPYKCACGSFHVGGTDERDN